MTTILEQYENIKCDRCLGLKKVLKADCSFIDCSACNKMGYNVRKKDQVFDKNESENKIISDNVSNNAQAAQVDQFTQYNPIFSHFETQPIEIKGEVKKRGRPPKSK